MKNWEKYEKEISKINNSAIAVVNGKPRKCSETKCASCDINSDNNGGTPCNRKLIEWLYQDDEIRVGDIVKHKDFDEVLVYVTVVGNHLVSGFGISHSNLGEVYGGHPKQFYVKTNKHIPLDKVIEFIGGTN